MTDNANVLNRFLQPGANGDNKLVLGGTVLGKTGVQAAAIPDISTTSGVMSTAERQAFNSVLAALRAVGVIAT